MKGTGQRGVQIHPRGNKYRDNFEDIFPRSGGISEEKLAKSSLLQEGEKEDAPPAQGKQETTP